MNIRKTTADDLNRISEIFAHARNEMAKNGNPTQWGNSGPSLSLVEMDISRESSYVVEHEGKIVGTFSFTIGEDPTYIKIYEGNWLNDKPYGTIHRIASDNSVKGVFPFVVDYVSKFGVDIRIDTHRNNHIMIHQCEKYGFKYCGIIYIESGDERVAFQKVIL